MNLRQLEVFYSIMQSGTVSGAAKNLNVSQPNITRVLAHTEQQLGFPLFERVKGRLVATNEARALLPEAERVYQQLGTFRSMTNKIKKGEQHIRVGAPPVLASTVLTPIVAKCLKEEQFSVELLTGHQNQMCDSLLKNEIDLAICFGGETPYSIEQVTLFEKELVAVIPASHAKEAQKASPLTISHLLNLGLPLIGLDERDPLGRQLNNLVQSCIPDYQYVVNVRSHNIAADLALHQAGVAVVDPWTASQFAHYSQVSLFSFTPSITISVSLLHAESYPLSITAKSFIEKLKKQ
ncbi:LysR family transcriptional regulator [Vibrio sp. S4M6]|uniref:LysR family transcriptional regulator n=1 Tax=Vibrio sinus TaxID=2946865 RepID=UPI00202A813A|nr:LysR family transcriptional regulator [Vibrio sinus]